MNTVSNVVFLLNIVSIIYDVICLKYRFTATGEKYIV